MTNNEAALLDMTFEEAQAKHNELKSLYGAMRLLLLEMRDRKGWKALGFESWEQYGELEWGFTRQHLNRLATSAYIQNLVEPIGSEIPESQLRPLTSVPDEAKIEIWQQVKSEHEKITGKVVQEAVDDWKEKNVITTDDVLCEKKSVAMGEPQTQVEQFSQEWGALILESSAIIVAEQKKTADAKRQIKKIKAEQENLVQKGVETKLTNVAIQMALTDSFFTIYKELRV